MPDDPKSSLPVSSPSVPSKHTGILAGAIRDELRGVITENPYLDLEGLSEVATIARHGRSLIAVRDPVSRFDAKGSGLGTLDEDSGFETSSKTWKRIDDGCGEWEAGTMARSVRKHHAEMIKETLSKSPLAKALRDEILAVVDQEPFSPANLLEVEQLAMHGYDVLAARLGMPPRRTNRRRRRGFGTLNPMYEDDDEDAMAPSSSPETFGAQAIQAAISASGKPSISAKEDLVNAIAAAKEGGLDEVAAGLTQQLLNPPPPPPAPAPSTNGESAKEGV